MKVKYFCFIAIFSSLLWLVISFVRGPFLGSLGGYKTSSLVGYILFFFFSVICIKWFEQKLQILLIVCAILTGLWILQLPLRIINFNESLGSLLDSFVHSLGIICGYFYVYLKNPAKIASSLLGLSIAFFVYFQGYDYWLHFISFGTPTGRIRHQNPPAKFEAFNESAILTVEKDFKNKVVLLDFWTTSCGICFQKFPKLQNWYENRKQDSALLVFAVNTPLEEDEPNQAFDVIKKLDYTFPVVITKDPNLAEKWGVIGYPTTFVINLDGQIVYKGDIEGAMNMVDELLKTN